MLHLLKNNFFNLYTVIGCVFVLQGTLAQAQQQTSNYQLVNTPQSVAINHKLPSGVIAQDEAVTVHFSKIPTDEEIYRAHFFEEPLVPSKEKDSVKENADLVFALATFSQRTNPNDFSSIYTFLKKYPNSRWKGSLLANLGIVYRRTGYYNKAMDAWQQAWDSLKSKTEPQIKNLADRVLSELLLINAWVGRKEKIDSLLKEIDHREIGGPAEERVLSVQEALWIMNNRTGISFKCGPYAINTLYRILDSTKHINQKLMDIQSTATGFSIAEVCRMAKDIGLNYQMAYRSSGAPIILNAVVHWKLGHYSALLSKDSITAQYKCEDATMGTTYGQQFWLSSDALDSSASGYFLVPEGTLPGGWRKVSTEEGNKVFGRGEEPLDKGKNTSLHNPHTCPQPVTTTKSGDNPKEMAQANVHLSSVSLQVFDSPLFYVPPKGPDVVWEMSYHQRDSYQPANFAYSNFGTKWTPFWLSYVQDNPANLSANADVYLMGGGVSTLTSFNATTQSYAPELETDDVLVRTSTTGCYELRHPDGSKDIYSRPDGSTVSGRRVFLTQRVDAAGNAITLSYDNNLRIAALQDALGQVTTIKYENANDIYKITSVTDPFGRSAYFDYDGLGRLIKITDMIGMVSTFQYQGTDFISGMTTPYGTTSFTKTEGNGTTASLDITYPLGEKERVEYREGAPGINDNNPSNTVPAGMPTTNAFLSYRNTFHWNKKQMLEAPGDYAKATIYHFLHGSSATNENGFDAPILESVKKPLENRIWYSYQGQSNSLVANQGMSASPAYTGRVLDDGTTQLTKYTYNNLGAITSSTDPTGRKLTYIYDSTNINLLEVRQTRGSANELLVKTTYNSQFLPLTTTDAAGLTTTYTYNSAGQLTTVTNPKHETTTLTYDANGYLKSIAGPVSGATVSFTYDGLGRVRTITDPEGYTVTTDYDALNRPTIITYPDSTYEQIVYNRLDAVHMKDRMGRWSHNTYDSLDRVSAIQDALGRITQFIWCSCGSLAEIVDGLKQVTTFTRDLEGRITAKTYNDGKTTAYQYENTTSRLKTTTDAKGQITNYGYFIDDNLKQVDYTNATIATPSVSFAYDTSYNRVDSMKDGTGTTAYAYYPVGTQLGAGLLSSIDGPLSNDVIAYGYDSLNRINSRAINGVPSSVVYDALGRMTSASNILGAFVYNYVDQTERLSSISLPNGQSTTFDYYNNAGDQRLKQILNQTSGGTILSKFNYEYNAESQIIKWTQQTGTSTPKYYELGYDLADQLTSATQKNQSTSGILKRFAYQYDKGSNRTSEQVDSAVTSAQFNSLNQMVNQQDGGPMRFKGILSEFASIKIKNTTTEDSTVASVDTSKVFEGFVKVAPGTDNISITATDYSGNNNTTVSNSAVSVTNGVDNTLNFDANGNTISETNPAVTYGWDAADRLVKITNGSNVTEFIYDGLSRRVAEKLNGSIIKRWLWCGDELCEERDALGSTVTKRFFAQGEQIGATKYYFTFDHLGSIREMTDVNGAVKARYDYDPYGRRTKVSGTVDADFGFTGHYYHAASGLYLTLYRAYDANAGRWLNRDPIEESGGFNLYAYVNGDPLNLIDPLGLTDAPGLGESLIPLWGSGKQAIHNFECGDYGWAAFNTAMAISDIFLLKALGTALLKGVVKVSAKEIAEKTLTDEGANLTQKALDHIIERHWYTSDAENAGKFAEGTSERNLKEMIETATTKGLDRPNTNGRPGKIFEHDFGNSIGTNSTGWSTSRIRVVVGPNGNIVTAFPY